MNVDSCLDSLRFYIEHRDFSGHDPYDALNSPLAPVLTAGTKWGRIALTQFLRRCPINLRSALLIRPGHNPKALALFLSSYCRLYRLRPDELTLRTINRLINLLEKTRSKGYSGSCWGYNFPWQSRAFFAPRWTPTSVASAFAGHALLDAYDVTGNESALDMALSVRNFILHDLKRISDGDCFSFTYSPLDDYAVHNASMLAASLLVRTAQRTHDPEARSASLNALAYTLKYQKPDGSWSYAERQGSLWVDSFHTGFVLESLRWFRMLEPSNAVATAYDKGVDFYAGNFFLPDGTPKYYHDRVYPIDIHSPAEAIVFFSGEGERWHQLTDRVVDWTIRNMRHPCGYFFFRRGVRSVNRISYMRWTQAWMFHALTAYAASRNSVIPGDCSWSSALPTTGSRGSPR